MNWKIEYFSETIEEDILNLPAGLLGRYIHLTKLMTEFGSNLGMPHTKAMSGGLFELRISGKNKITRSFYCVLKGKRIVI